MASFVDVHMHAMSLSEPDFGAFVSQLMKDPAASIGGSISLESSDRGTTVSIKAPIMVR